jgi:hypothetical protein
MACRGGPQGALVQRGMTTGGAQLNGRSRPAKCRYF